MDGHNPWNKTSIFVAMMEMSLYQNYYWIGSRLKELLGNISCAPIQTTRRLSISPTVVVIDTQLFFSITIFGCACQTIKEFASGIFFLLLFCFML